MDLDEVSRVVQRYGDILSEADLLEDYEEDDYNPEDVEPLYPWDLGWGEDYLETDDYEEEEL